MREVGGGVRLVEVSARVLSVRRKVARHDVVYIEVPAYLEDLEKASMSQHMHNDSLNSCTFIGSKCKESSSLILFSA